MEKKHSVLVHRDLKPCHDFHNHKSYLGFGDASGSGSVFTSLNTETGTSDTGAEDSGVRSTGAGDSGTD